MGNDKLAVVDPQLKLRGAQNIWINDASVSPKIISGNTNAPTLMIGERIADFIFSSLSYYRLAAIRAYRKMKSSHCSNRHSNA